jgi:K+-sensing histidine kinase KdpD
MIEQPMAKVSRWIEVTEKYLLAVIVVAAATGLMLLIGRETLGEGVIALLYLAPISWMTARWGQGPGIAAAVTSALAFNFFFIPPFYTLYIGSPEGWLLLAIFLTVAILIVGRIQVGFAKAQQREREATYLYELTAALSGTHTPAEIARILAGQIQQFHQAEAVQVVLKGVAQQSQEGPVVTRLPQSGLPDKKPDRLYPLLETRKIVGEIRVWQGLLPLPPLDDRLVQNITYQAGLALERAQG